MGMIHELHIRGIYASASLKLDRYLAFWVDNVDIRGIYASASLKRRPRYSLPLSRRHIRGIYASASLKHVQFGRGLVRRGEYPRHLRLGLIEALMAGGGCPSRIAISEAFTPRPH